MRKSDNHASKQSNDGKCHHETNDDTDGARFFPVIEPDKMMGKMGKMQGEIIKLNPSIKARMILTSAVCIITQTPVYVLCQLPMEMQVCSA